MRTFLLIKGGDTFQSSLRLTSVLGQTLNEVSDLVKGPFKIALYLMQRLPRLRAKDGQ